MKLWVFNPWNDLALAADVAHYTPPPLVRELELAGQTAMMWIAAPDDFVLVENLDLDWYSRMSSRYRLAHPWRGEKVDGCVPWGWSKALVARLSALGIDRNVMPRPEVLDELRMLSHRRLTAEIHTFLGSPFVPAECRSVSECEQFLKKWKKVMGKSPWSSTGRGVFSGDSSAPALFLQRCAGIICRQGSVMIEPLFDVLTDFAMLFHSDGRGTVRFSGYSLFSNRNRAYTGNIITSDADIARILSAHVPESCLQNVRDSLERFLSAKVGNVYCGHFGVDMLIYRDPAGRPRLNPCVEVNLRLTMGVVAMLLRNRRLPADFKGIFSVGRDEPAANVMRLSSPGARFHFTVSPHP